MDILKKVVQRYIVYSWSLKRKTNYYFIMVEIIIKPIDTIISKFYGIL